MFIYLQKIKKQEKKAKNLILSKSSYFILKLTKKPLITNSNQLKMPKYLFYYI